MTITSRKTQKLCAELKTLRLSRGLTQVETAHLIGIHPNTLVNWEGEVIPDQSLPKLEALHGILTRLPERAAKRPVFIYRDTGTPPDGGRLKRRIKAITALTDSDLTRGGSAFGGGV